MSLSARAVVTAVFFAFAVGLGLWAGAIPALMRQSGLDVAGLGIALTFHTAAYIAAMAGGGQLARIVPPRRLMLLAMAANLPCFGLLFTAGSPLWLTLALTAMGLSAGLLDLAMNTEGTAVEHDLHRPVLLSMHVSASAAFALGALGGSLIGTAAGPAWCALLVLGVSLPVMLALHRLGPRPHPVVAPLAVPASRGAGHGVARVGIVLGQLFAKALGDRKGINRAGYFVMPMDETLSVTAIDLGGRPALVYNDKVKTRLVGDLQSELVHDFFDGFAVHAGANVHVLVLYGRSNHHKLESIFKGFARAMKFACSTDARLKDQLPSTKGLLEGTNA